MVFAMFAAAVVLAAAPAPRSEILAGQQLARENCGACHAVGPKDASPMPPAPPLRQLNQHFDIEGLPESLAEGISVGHPKMPQVIWEARDIEAFMAYLRSLQPTKPHVRR
jgi:mono/diheme cytochrome c family protein